MTATTTGDAPASAGDGVRLRLDVYDTLAKVAGATTPSEQAELHGMSRAHMYRLRAGDREPSLDLAMKMAADLQTKTGQDVTVEDLFERVVS